MRCWNRNSLSDASNQTFQVTICNRFPAGMRSEAMEFSRDTLVSEGSRGFHEPTEVTVGIVLRKRYRGTGEVSDAMFKLADISKS